MFAPKEFFHEVLEKQFAKVIVKFIKVDATNQMIEKPTITLNRVSPTQLILRKIRNFEKNLWYLGKLLCKYNARCRSTDGHRHSLDSKYSTA